MPKLNAILVLSNAQKLNGVLQTLNFAKVNLLAIMVNGGDGKFLNLGKNKIPFVSFARVKRIADTRKDCYWLISSFLNNVGDLWSLKDFLMQNGVPEDNIVNLEVTSHLSVEWLANLRYVENHGADFFATGISYAEVGLDLDYIPHIRGRGVNLSCSNQDLRQSYLTARHIFARVAPGTVKFVLIGLAPYAFRYDCAQSFSVCSRNLQYMLALDAPPVTFHDELLNTLVGDNVKKTFLATTDRQADLNFDATKIKLNDLMPVRAVINWKNELNNLIKKYRPQVAEQNFQILRDYIKLCRDCNAKPIGFVLPFAPVIQKNYEAELLANFREALRRLDLTCIDLFNLELDYDCFYNMAHLNMQGAAQTSTILGLRLYSAGVLSIENFRNTHYQYFDTLSEVLSKENYNGLLNQVFYLTAAQLRRKPKLKVGFVLYDAAMWCGDDLYNYFAANPRFEPTIIFCRRTDMLEDDDLMKADFTHGAEQFRARGLHVTPLEKKDSAMPAQDVLFFLTPYFEILPDAVQPANLTAHTLLAYIPYGFNATTFNIYNTPVYHFGWRLFFDTQYHIDLLKRECRTGMERGLFSGYPKLDSFFRSRADFNFKWKSTRSDAKKIIWAPHWSINNGVMYSTFQWNYRFMYEFARSHPETSWVVKPHPNLLFSAVTSGLFPNKESFEEYLQAWNDLPNAQVYTGGYYQEIFATSDGLIHDGGSFIAEYQYAQKPMIYLRRDTQQFNDLGAAILNVSYLVDGRDLRRIGELMTEIFIKGNDPMRATRKKFFDEQLNYFERNGMTAAEFIYRCVAAELT